MENFFKYGGRGREEGYLLNVLEAECIYFYGLLCGGRRRSFEAAITYFNLRDKNFFERVTKS